MVKDVDPSTPAVEALANLWLCEGPGCTGQGEGQLVIKEWAFNADGPEGLGAYEFQLKFDHKIFDIEIEDAGFLGSTGRTVNCTMTIISENDIRFGCVSSDPTPGPPIPPGPTGSAVLANVYVRPEPDLRYRLTPGQENGVIRTLLDENCELADVFGDPLAAASTDQDLDGELDEDPINGVDDDGDTTIDEDWVDEVLLPGILPGGLLATCADAILTVRILEGDLNLDCRVDVVDDQMAAFRYGAFVGNLLYDPWYDLEPALKDFDVDIKDLQKVFGRNGSGCQAPIPDQSPLPPAP
jgi:hypothetical protein